MKRIFRFRLEDNGDNFGTARLGERPFRRFISRFNKYVFVDHEHGKAGHKIHHLLGKCLFSIFQCKAWHSMPGLKVCQQCACFVFIVAETLNKQPVASVNTELISWQHVDKIIGLVNFFSFSSQLYESNTLKFSALFLQSKLWCVLSRIFIP